jgi:hypothetical protein
VRQRQRHGLLDILVCHMRTTCIGGQRSGGLVDDQIAAQPVHAGRGTQRSDGSRPRLIQANFWQQGGGMSNTLRFLLLTGFPVEAKS